jgi:hypothetical protein
MLSSGKIQGLEKLTLKQAVYSQSAGCELKFFSGLE